MWGEEVQLHRSYSICVRFELGPTVLENLIISLGLPPNLISHFLLEKQKVSFSPFRPLYSRVALSKTNLFLAVSGRPYLMFNLREFSAGSGSFSEPKKKPRIFENTTFLSTPAADFSVLRDWGGPSWSSLRRGTVTEADSFPPHHRTGTSVYAAPPRAGLWTWCGENQTFFLISDRKEQSQRLFSRSAVCLCGCIFSTKQRKR